MQKREFELTTRDAAFVEECLASGDWNDADEVLQAALTLLRCHDFGEEGARAAVWEHLQIDEADADIAANGVIEVEDVGAWLEERHQAVRARNRDAA